MLTIKYLEYLKVLLKIIEFSHVFKHSLELKVLIFTESHAELTGISYSNIVIVLKVLLTTWEICCRPDNGYWFVALITCS